MLDLELATGPGTENEALPEHEAASVTSGRTSCRGAMARPTAHLVHACEAHIPGQRVYDSNKTHE